MVHGDQLLITLIRSFAAARGISVSYASRLLTGSGDTVDRVAAGASITARRAETILRRASARWPAGRDWPAGIPRPAPADELSQETSERETPMTAPAAPPESMDHIVALARSFAAARQATEVLAEDIKASQRKALAGRLRALRNRIAEQAASEDALRAAIQARPDLFASPRTLAVDGVKFGLRKQPGAVALGDEAQAIRRLRERFPRPGGGADPRAGDPRPRGAAQAAGRRARADRRHHREGDGRGHHRRRPQRSRPRRRRSARRRRTGGGGMRSGHRSGVQHVPSRGARANAERLWRETVASSPADDLNGGDTPHLTPALSSPRGGEGEKAAASSVPSPPLSRNGGDATAAACVPSPPLGAERDRERWGKSKRDPRRSSNGSENKFPLPSGSATRKLRALWISAFHLGLIRDSSDGALAAWLRRLLNLDAETCLTPDGIAHAIQPLEAWLARAGGVDWRPHLSFGRSGHVREVRRPRARVLEAQWRILYRQGRVRIGSHAALGAYASRFAGLGRADSHLALNDAQADALIRHLGRCIRKAGAAREKALGRRGAHPAAPPAPSLARAAAAHTSETID